mgnify:CR=1 FL=1
MALDEPREDDNTYHTDGITWLVAKDDLERVLGEKGVRVDHVKSWYGSGFTIAPKGASPGTCC